MSDDDLKCESSQAMNEIPAPALPYLPEIPKTYSPAIGLIGCGGITSYHLEAYKRAGLNVTALCDIDEARALERQTSFYPEATIYREYKDLLARDDVEVVDIATHAEVRAPIIEDTLNAGKHVLSQKPFVLDLEVGERLADLADERGLKLAVNQNGRWAPHFSYIRRAISQGIIGEVTAAHLSVFWDHRWTADTVFDEIPHMILYDFGIHWFDILTCFMNDRKPLRVYAAEASATGQINKSAMLAQADVTYEGCQASLVFAADILFGAVDETRVCGTKGTITSTGPDLGNQAVVLYNAEGFAKPELEGEWFKNGFLGTMGELLCSVEEDREPFNSARNNLRSLELCFAALASAEKKEPQVPGTVRRLPGA